MEMTSNVFVLYKLFGYGATPLYWVIFFVTCTFVCAVLPYSPGRQRWVRCFSMVSLVILLVTTNPLIAFLIMGSLEAWHTPAPITPTEHFDAIVVLGGGVQDRGTLRPRIELTETSQHRTFCGVELYQRGLTPILLLSGGDNRIDGHGPVEASVMKERALRLGITAAAIIEEARSRTTYENAVESSRLLRANASVLLVTSAYHLPRAVGLFTKQGLKVTPAPCCFYYGNHPSENWMSLGIFALVPSPDAFDHVSKAIGEMIGMLVYWVMGKF